MSQKRTYKQYSREYKEEAVALVTDQGYSVPKAAESLGINPNMLYKWKEKFEAEARGKSLLRERNEVKFDFIKAESRSYPVTVLCRVMQVSRSAYYDWCKRPATIIDAETLHIHRRMKALFKQSRQSLGSREMMKKLREEGIDIGRYKVRKLMGKLGLKVKQRVAYKVTTKRNPSDAVAVNLLNQNFNPVGPNQVWAGDITYLKTGEGWMYLAIVMDLFSRRIVGWHIDKRMTTDLIIKAMMKAYNLRQPPKGLVFHSDRGSQYTSQRFGKLLQGYGIRPSMGDVGACWDNAVVERFFGSLKHDWLFKIAQPTRRHMKKDVAAYMKYYNLDRLHTANDDMSPVKYEQVFNQAA